MNIMYTKIHAEKVNSTDAALQAYLRIAPATLHEQPLHSLRTGDVHSG